MIERPSIEELRERFFCNPETAEVFQRRSLQAGFNSSEPVGFFDGKYRRIQVGKQRIAEHRVIWALVHGEWPDEIDHIDRNKLNNRISNLRVATRSQNGANRQVAGKIPYKGVVANPNGKRFTAMIWNGAKKYLGTFDTADEAAHAYNKAAIEFYGEFACLNPIGVNK